MGATASLIASDKPKRKVRGKSLPEPRDTRGPDSLTTGAADACDGAGAALSVDLADTAFDSLDFATVGLGAEGLAVGALATFWAGFTDFAGDGFEDADFAGAAAFTTGLPGLTDFAFAVRAGAAIFFGAVLTGAFCGDLDFDATGLTVARVAAAGFFPCADADLGFAADLATERAAVLGAVFFPVTAELTLGLLLLVAITAPSVVISIHV